MVFFRTFETIRNMTSLTKQLFLPKTVEVEDTYNDEPYRMTVKVYPESQTLHFANLIRRAQNGTGDDAADAYAEACSLLVTEWDIELDGKPFPPTKENFLRVPRDFVDRVFEKAWEAISEAEPKVTYIEDAKEVKA